MTDLPAIQRIAAAELVEHERALDRYFSRHLFDRRRPTRDEAIEAAAALIEARARELAGGVS